jgi:hypothetical protein
MTAIPKSEQNSLIISGRDCAIALFFPEIKNRWHSRIATINIIGPCFARRDLLTLQLIIAVVARGSAGYTGLNQFETFWITIASIFQTNGQSPSSRYHFPLNYSQEADSHHVSDPGKVIHSPSTSLVQFPPDVGE